MKCFSFIRVAMVMVSPRSNRNPNEDRSWYQALGIAGIGCTMFLLGVLWKAVESFKHCHTGRYLEECGAELFELCRTHSRGFRGAEFYYVA